METSSADHAAPGLRVIGVAQAKLVLARHEYFRIEIDRVLAIVERDLPPLERAIDRLLSE